MRSLRSAVPALLGYKIAQTMLMAKVKGKAMGTTKGRRAFRKSQRSPVMDNRELSMKIPTPPETSGCQAMTLLK